MNDKDKSLKGKPDYDVQLKSFMDLFKSQLNLDKRKTVTRGKHSYYELPNLYANNKQFSDKLKADKRCTNCGDCDPLYPFRLFPASSCTYNKDFDSTLV